MIHSAMPVFYDDRCVCDKPDGKCVCESPGQSEAYAKENFKVIIMNWRR